MASSWRERGQAQPGGASRADRYRDGGEPRDWARHREGLAEQGIAVAGVSRTAPALEALRWEIEERGGSFLPVPADIARIDAIPTWVAGVWDWAGPVQILVNAAGVSSRTGPLEVTEEEWDRVFAVNLKAAFFLAQEVGRRMLEGSGGSIVQIASLSAVVSDGAQVQYSASKAAVVRMAAVLAQQWAPKVRVNSVSPGWVRSTMTESFLSDEGNLRRISSHTPLARVADPGEMVGAVLFLASDMSSFVTGQNIVVDGGWTC